MATVLGLAMKITADASGLSQSLTPVDRALQKLGEQASASAALFDRFVGSTSGAGAAQRQLATDVAFLTSALKTGQVQPQEFAKQFAALQANASAAAASFAEGAAIAEQFATAQERSASRLERLTQLFDLGALKIETYNRASADAIGINEKAAQSEQERARFSARAAQLQEQARGPLGRYDAEVIELAAHLQAATIDEEQFNVLLEQATQRFIRAESAAKGYDAAVETAGRKGNMSFAELSGTLAILPGPIGNIAGRLSGLSSAAEGLNRTFSNGGGIGQFGVALAGLVNPATLAVGALAAFGAGAVAVGRGLVQLEGEVERLAQFADRLGVSFGFIQVLETASNQTGTSIESLGSSFTKFLKTVDDARSGGKEAAQAFRDLGLSAEDVRDSNPESLFTRSADALAKLSDPARRAAAAVALFGKSGTELVPVFRQLGQAANDMDRIGGILTDQQQQDVLAFGDAMDRVGVASQGFSRQITASFASFGKNVADATAESIGAINRFMKSLDDTAQDKTWAGFQKSAERLRVDQEIIASRNRLNAAAQETRSNEAIAKLISSLGLADDGTISLNGELAKAQQQAAAFGNKGVGAFLSYVKTLEDIAAAAEGAGLSQDQLDRAVATAGRAFEEQIKLLGLEEAAQGKAADAATRAADARIKAAERLAEIDRQKADAFIQQNNIGDAGLKAAEDLLAITRQIEEAEAAIADARASNDKAAEDAAVRRLRILDQAQAAAQDTADLGFNANDIQQAIKAAQGEMDGVIERAGQFGQEGFNAALKFQQGLEGARKKLEAPDGGLLDPQGFNAAIAGQKRLFDERVRRLEEVRDLELEIAKEKAALEEETFRKVTARTQPLQLADVRTTEGQRQFFQAANLFEDPALAEYRRGREAIERLERKLDAARKVEIK